MTDCDQLDFFAVLDGTADASALRHVQECAACREEFGRFRRLAGLLDAYFRAVEGECSWREGLVELVLDGVGLPADLDAHMGECPECRRLVDLLRDVAATEVEAEDATLPPALAERVEAFRREQLKARTLKVISRALGTAEDDAKVIRLGERVLGGAGIALVWWVALQTIPQPTLYRAFAASLSRVLSVGVLAFAVYLATRPLPGHIRRAVACPAHTLLLRLPGDGGEVRIRVAATPLLLGRAGDCDVVIDAAHVSARHCRVWAEEGRVLIQDLGSTNGTWVGDGRLGHAPATMTSNRQFLLGGVSHGLSLSLEDR